MLEGGKAAELTLLALTSPQRKFPVCQALFLIEKLFSVKSCICCQATASPHSLGWIRLLQRSCLNYSFKPGPAVFHFLTRTIRMNRSQFNSSDYQHRAAHSQSIPSMEGGGIPRQEITEIPTEFGLGSAEMRGFGGEKVC